MILKLQDTRGFVEWFEVEKVQRLGLTDEIIDGSDAIPSLRWESDDGQVSGTKKWTVPPIEEESIEGSVAPVTNPSDDGGYQEFHHLSSHIAKAACRLHAYFGCDTRLAEYSSGSNLPTFVPSGDQEGTLTVDLPAPEPAVLWFLITPTVGKAYVLGATLLGGWLMSDAGKTLDSLL